MSLPSFSGIMYGVMKRIIILVVASLLVVVGLFLLTRVLFSFGPKGQGALQVTASVKSTVYLNDKPLGETPLCKCNQGETLESGTYSVKVVPLDASLDPYVVQIDIEPNVLTAVDRTFLPGSLASAYTLTLKKTNKDTPELLVTSLPEGALVTVDGNEEEITPYLIEDITASEHEISIQKSQFNKKTIRVRTVPGYRLVVYATLGTDSENIEEQFRQPTPISPTPEKTVETITILDTPTGFLRVRSGSSTGTSEVGRVEPGETYEIITEENDWYQIKLSDGKQGWVSAQFAEKAASSSAAPANDE